MPLPEVHVGDIGTKYRVRIRDEDGDFDPSGAVIKSILFKLPQSSVALEKNAMVEAGDSPATFWYLTYTVQSADGAGSPPGEFHEMAGRVSMQGYLEYADGSQFHTNVMTTDDDGTGLRVYPNLG